MGCAHSITHNFFEMVFQLGNFGKMENTARTRQERVRKEGSPYYTYSMPALAASASVSIAMEQQFPDSRKYQPLDFLEITNNEAANDLTIVINGTTSLSVPAGVIKVIKNTAFWHVSLTNNGALITTLGKVSLVFQKQSLTIDDYARRQK